MRIAPGWRIAASLAAVALTSLACPACSGGDGLPTGSWHPHQTTGGNGGGSNASGSSGGGSSSGTASSGSGSSSSGGSGSSGAGSSGSGSSSGGTGSSGGSSGASGSSSGAQQSANVAVSVDKSAVQMQLLDQTVLHVSVAPNGYAGSVALSLGALPSGVTGTFDHASLSLDGTTTATAILTVHTDTSPAPGAVPIAIDASASGTTKSAAVALTVEAKITLHIPAGVDSMGGTVQNPVMTAYGPYPIQITAPAGLSSSNPVDVYFMNDDAVSHQIHADASGQGFGHDPGSFGGGTMDPYVRKVNTAGTYDFYLHDQGQAITIGRIEIK